MNPPNRYLQSDCWQAMRSSRFFPMMESRSQAILRKVFSGRNGIESRWLCFDHLDEAFQLDPDTLQHRFENNAPLLATQAAQQAIEEAGIPTETLDAVVVSTCTGYLCPGLSSYLNESLGLKPGTLGLDLVGQGCGAALPNLRTASSLIHSGEARRVLSVCVEICSAAFYLDNDPGVLISACLFGDGAAAVVLDQEESRIRGWTLEWQGGWSGVNPAKRDLLRFETVGGMLRNILRPEVPEAAAEEADLILQQAMKQRGTDPESISKWICHAGGRDVLQALQRKWNLPENAMASSAAVLKEYGNLSSPSVLFALSHTLDHATGKDEGNWWMTSFGAGFSCHGALWNAKS